MRRFQGLLIAAGLAAAPASAVAGPSPDHPRSPSRTFEHFEWSTSKGRLGAMVMSMTPELRKHLGAAEDRGVLVERVEPATPAAAAGLAVGDVIVSVGGHPVDGAGDVLAALAGVRKDQQVAVEVVRDRKPLTLHATLADDPPPARFGQPRWLRPFDDEDDDPFAPLDQPGWFRDWMKWFRAGPDQPTTATRS